MKFKPLNFGCTDLRVEAIITKAKLRLLWLQLEGLLYLNNEGAVINWFRE